MHGNANANVSLNATLFDPNDFDDVIFLSTLPAGFISQSFANISKSNFLIHFLVGYLLIIDPHVELIKSLIFGDREFNIF